MGTGPLPSYLIPEVALPKDRIHQHLQVVGRRRVAVEIDTACRLQNPPHLKKPHSHHGKVRLHPLAVGKPSRLQCMGHRGLLVGYEAHPSHVKV